MTQSGENNPNWRGGRSIASNGYVLIRVGVDHHLADVRGYAYEHRIVAEEKLGRRLAPDEIVHHKDEDPLNNNPDNLEVVTGNAEHLLHHRKKISGRRLPHEANPMVLCACGCGVEFSRFDGDGRPRLFIAGHNVHNETQTLVLEELRNGNDRLMTIARAINKSKTQTSNTLRRLCELGLAVRVGYGRYQGVS